MINFGVIGGFLDGLRPAPRMTVSQWAVKYRKMTSENSMFAGDYDLDKFPYLEEIMDCLSPYDPTEEVIFKKSSQVGATQAGNNWIGAIMHLYLGKALMVLPNDELADVNAKDNIQAMIDDTDELRKKVAPARQRDSGNTTRDKRGPGFKIAIRSAGSPNTGRSTSYRWIYMDELSAYKMNVGKEGDPYTLIKGRSKGYGSKRKIFSTSTPGLEGNCRISTLYETTDKRRYHVPCPCCGKKQPLEFERLRYTVGVFIDVYYECVNGCKIYEWQKTEFMTSKRMVGDTNKPYAEWIATAPENISKAKRGYHISALYTPLGMYSWEQMARDYEEAYGPDGTPELQQTFDNLQKGETYSPITDIPDWKELHTRAQMKSVAYDDTIFPDCDPEDSHIPHEVAALTAGVDVQADRLEVTIKGWAAGQRTYGISYKVLPGSPDDDLVWEQLRDYLESDFVRKDGGKMQVAFTCVDSGFLKDRAYEFCEAFGSTRCVPVKGGPDSQNTPTSQGRSAKINKRGKQIGRTMFYMLGVGYLKERFYSKLKRKIDPETGEIPTGYMYFPCDRDEYYFKGMCSEVKVTKNGKTEWKKIVLRNEPLDLEVYAHAAGHFAGLTERNDEWFTDTIAKFAPERKEFTQIVKRERRAGGWLDRG